MFTKNKSQEALLAFVLSLKNMNATLKAEITTKRTSALSMDKIIALPTQSGKTID